MMSCFWKQKQKQTQMQTQTQTQPPRNPTMLSEDAEAGGLCSYRCATEMRVPFSRCKFLLIYFVILFPIALYHSVIFHFHILPHFLKYEVKVVVHDYVQPNATEPRIPVSGPEVGYLVPNIVHFIVFGENKTFKFIHYLSVLSAFRVQRPNIVMMHCDNLPIGPWWEKLWRQVPVQLVHREPPETIHGQHLSCVYHQSDIAKMEVLQEYGGIYLDFDVIVINTLDPLRKYPMTLGKEKPPKLIAGIMVAERNALFLRLLYESYRNNYWSRMWDYNCADVAYRLYLKRPDLVYVEMHGLTTPDWTERHLLYENTVDWRRLYVLHLMWHDRPKSISPENIQTMKGILGEVLRNVFYGDPQMIT